MSRIEIISIVLQRSLLCLIMLNMMVNVQSLLSAFCDGTGRLTGKFNRKSEPRIVAYSLVLSKI